MKHTILLVTPDAQLQALIGVTLESKTSELVGAVDVDSALSVAHERPVDLILFDSAALPLIDRRLCHLPSLTAPDQHVPVVVLTHDASPERRERCLAEGAAGVLPRPFSPLTLIETVEHLVGTPGLPPASVAPLPLVVQMPTPPQAKAFTVRNVALMVAVMVLVAVSSSVGIMWWHERQEERSDLRSIAALPDTVERSRPFVVMLAASDSGTAGLGTGVMYEPSGKLVTNAHVVEGQRTVDVVFSDNVVRHGTVLGSSTTPDLAVVQVDGEGNNFPAARFGSTVRDGERVAVLGFPLTFALGANAGAFEGVVSKQIAGVDGRLIQVDVSVNPGMSGAPVLNVAGEVVGLVSSRVETVNGRNIIDVALAIPAPVVVGALPSLSAGLREAPVNSTSNTTDTAMGAALEFLRLLRLREAGTAYHWLSTKAQAAMPETQFEAMLGYSGASGLLAGLTRVVNENATSATVSIDVLVSRPKNGVVESQWQTELWRVVRETGGWRLDERLSAQQNPP